MRTNVVTLCLFSLALFFGSFSALPQVEADVVTWDSYSWNQENEPNIGSEITSGTLGGATFNVASNDVTGPLTNFPASVTGGTFNDQVGVLSVLIGDQPGGTRAVNLPFGDNIGGETLRRGISVGWAENPTNHSQQYLPNQEGDDFVIFESGTQDVPEALMARVRSAKTGSYSDWYYFAPQSQAMPTTSKPDEVLFSYAFDLSDMGIPNGLGVDQIQVANMTASDRIDAVGTLGDSVTMTTQMAPSFVNGRTIDAGKALEFDGSSNFGTFESDVFADVGKKGTLSLWVMMDDTSKRNQLIEGPGDAGMEFQYRSNSGGQFYGRANTAGDYAIQDGGASSVEGNWVNVQYTWDADTSQMQIFLDGVEVGYLSGYDSDLSGFDILNATDLTAGPITVGADPGSGRFFDGIMDDLAFFSDVLSQSELDTIRINGVDSLPASSSLVAYWNFEDTLIDQISGVPILYYGTGVFDTYLAEGVVLPEHGGLYAVDNPGPDPGPLASFNIPYGNNTFDPDPLYIAILQNLQVPEPGTITIWSLLALGSVGLVSRSSRRKKIAG